MGRDPFGSHVRYFVLCPCNVSLSLPLSLDRRGPFVVLGGVAIYGSDKISCWEGHTNCINVKDCLDFRTPLNRALVGKDTQIVLMSKTVLIPGRP